MMRSDFNPNWSNQDYIATMYGLIYRVHRKKCFYFCWPCILNQWLCIRVCVKCFKSVEGAHCLLVKLVKNGSSSFIHSYIILTWSKSFVKSLSYTSTYITLYKLWHWVILIEIWEPQYFLFFRSWYFHRGFKVNYL